MDQETIDAMRRMVDDESNKGAIVASRGSDGVYTGDRYMPLSTFQLAVAGFRELVEREAEQATVAPLDDKDAESLAVVVDYLKLAVESVVRSGGGHVRISSEDDVRCVYSSTALAAVRAIEALTAARVAKPLEQTAKADPSLEKFVAAVNKAKHRGWDDWELGATAGDGTWLGRDELEGLGRLLIDREREVERAAVSPLDDEALTAVNTEKAAAKAEPSLKECVAAMNRADYCGYHDWELGAVTQPEPGLVAYRSNLDTMAVGAWLIERERAAKKKGGGGRDGTDHGKQMATPMRRGLRKHVARHNKCDHDEGEIHRQLFREGVGEDQS